MKKLYFIGTILFYSSYLLAETEHISNLNLLQYKNQQSLLNLKEIRQNQWINSHQYQSELTTPEDNNFSTSCLPYNDITLLGITLIDPTPLIPKKGECINEARLNKLSKDLTAAYLKKGYIHTPFQFEDDGSQTLIMNVKEGKVIQLTTNSPRLNLSMLYPHLLNSPLKIQDLDQGLDQANKLFGSNVSIDVYPYKNGDISVKLISKDTSLIHGNFTINNNASKQFKRWQMSANLSIDNLFSLSDFAFFSFTHTLHSINQNFNRSFSFYHSIPYGNWTINTFGAYSNFNSQTKLVHNTVEQEGKTVQVGLKTDYVFYRSTNHISTVALQIEKTNIKNEFENSILELQSPKFTDIQLSLEHLHLIPNGSWIINLSYERGVNLWNNLSSSDKALPQAKYNKWNADIQFQRYFKALDLYLFKHSHQLQAQYSTDYLPPIKQAELLGNTSIEGFNDLSSYAEKQIFLKNRLSWIKTKNNWNISPYIGFDMGIQKNIDKNKSKGIGYIAGVNLSYNEVNIAFQYGKGRLFTKNDIMEDNQIQALIKYIF